MLDRLPGDLCAVVASFLHIKQVALMSTCSPYCRSCFDTDRAWRACALPPTENGMPRGSVTNTIPLSIIPEISTSEKVVRLFFGSNDAINAFSAEHCYRTACLRGWLDKAKWVSQLPKIGAILSYSITPDLFEGTCNGGHLSTAQWLFDKFPYKSIVDRFRPALINACAYGHLHVAIWLVQKRDDAIAVENEKKTYPLLTTTRDKLLVRCIAVAAAKGGHLGTLQWLVHTFFVQLRPVLLAAIAWGRERVVQWLIAQNTSHHMRPVRWTLQLKALHVAAEHNHIAIVQILAARFGLLPRNLHPGGAQRALTLAIQQRRFNLARWIIATEPRRPGWPPTGIPLLCVPADWRG